MRTLATISSRPTLSPTVTVSSVTVPSTGAASESSIFIDSSTTIGLPRLDRVADAARHEQHGARHRRPQLPVGVRVMDVLGGRLGHVPRPPLEREPAAREPKGAWPL